MGLLNNPIPSSMASECRKTGKILASFVDPKQAFGMDKVIPPEILSNAKGLAIMTVFKVGFLGSGRFGSGVAVARLSDGTWSAPTAIGTAGAGFGGQLGFELTDFVFILNDANAVKTFAQAGSLTLGGNVSIAAGPTGRNAEAAGAASLKSLSGVFAYSKTKGLFAGVSLEGSVIIERRDANEKLYNRRVTAAGLLSGQVPVPPAAEPLMRVLNSRVFSGVRGNTDTVYNDIPVYGDTDNNVWQGKSGSAYGEGVRTDRTGTNGYGQAADDEYVYQDRAPQRASTWQDSIYDQPTGRTNSVGNNRLSRANPGETFDSLAARGRSNTFQAGDDYSYSDTKAKPTRPTAPKPQFLSRPSAQKGQAIAKFNFDPDQPGDLGFKKGEVITIVKKTDNAADWWTGRIGDREGVFPSNYVEVV